MDGEDGHSTSKNSAIDRFGAAASGTPAPAVMPLPAAPKVIRPSRVRLASPAQVADSDGHLPLKYSVTLNPKWDAAINALDWYQPDPKYTLWVKVILCPRCVGRVQFVYHLELHAGFRLPLFSAALSGSAIRVTVPEAGVRVRYACTCARAHPSGPGGCGAQFLLMPPVAPEVRGQLVLKQGPS